MARVFYVHWSKEEALPTVRALRAAGHTVVYHWDQQTGADTWRRLKEHPPDLLVVSLERLPSHGRRVAAVTRETKRMSGVPVVFVGGAAEKVAVARKEFPRAAYTGFGELVAVVGRQAGSRTA